MTRERTIILLTLGFFSTILLEIFLKPSIQSSSRKITLFEHLQPSLTLITSIDGILQRVSFSGLFLLLLGFLMDLYTNGLFVIYIILLKFFELIPLLIDLINLLFICQYKMKDIHQQHSFHRLHLSLILIFIRFIMSLHVVRRKCDCRWKRQVLILFDLLLFILINITLIRYTHPNPIRIGRKIILGVLIFQLNNLFYHKTFWIDFTRWNDDRRHHRNSTKVQRIISTFDLENMIHLMLFIRWILSSFIVCLFLLFTFQSITISENGNLFFFKHVYSFFKTHGWDVMMSMIILIVIYWDTLQNRDTLNQHGISCFCIGFNLLPRIRSTETSSHSKGNISTTTVEKNTKSPSISTKKTCQTPLVSYDNED